MLGNRALCTLTLSAKTDYAGPKVESKGYLRENVSERGKTAGPYGD